jgi:thioredoxin-like negative regulator of GroEL
MSRSYETPMQSLNDHSFFHILEAPGASGLVVLTKPGCGACRHVKALLSALGPELPTPLFELNVEESPGVAAELDVFHLPAMFLFRDGELLGPVHAEARREALFAAIMAAWRSA